MKLIWDRKPHLPVTPMHTDFLEFSIERVTHQIVWTHCSKIHSAEK